MSAFDNYQEALDSLAEAIRAAGELIDRKHDPRTYATAIEKRALEKQLRDAGYTKAGAAREVARIFRIQRLGDDE